MNKNQCTKFIPNDTDPQFNENLFFLFKDLKVWELESGMITIKLMNHSYLKKNNVLGTFTVDLSYIY